MRKPRQPDPEVMESDYRVPTALGTAAWLVALVVLLLLGDRLPESDRWWLWVCLTGIALGVFGYLYIPRLLRKREEAEERAEQRHAARRRARAETDDEPTPASPTSPDEDGGDGPHPSTGDRDGDTR